MDPYIYCIYSQSGVLNTSSPYVCPSRTPLAVVVVVVVVVVGLVVVVVAVVIVLVLVIVVVLL